MRHRILYTAALLVCALACLTGPELEQTRARAQDTATAAAAAAPAAESATKSPVFLRFKVTRPADESLRVTVTGGTHGINADWTLPGPAAEVDAGAWSDWLDLTQWPWHGRSNRSGGVAEWYTIKLTATPGTKEPLEGVEFEVQLADKPDERSAVHTFTESSESNTIAFLAPWPLRENAKEFETGSQMAARHLAWAKEATGGEPIVLKQFIVATGVHQYDPALARQQLEAIRLLGFNATTGVAPGLIRAADLRHFAATNIDLGNQFHVPDPAVATHRWEKFKEYVLDPALATDDGKWRYTNLPFFEISDEVAMVNFAEVEDPANVHGWFRDYLRSQNITEGELGQPIDQVEYPLATMFAQPMPREADLATRRLIYHAAKFGHWWAAKQMRHSSDLIRGSLPGTKTLAMPWGHPFFAGRGMNRFMLDLFELAEQGSVDVLASEDWLGLNYMYWSSYTWTGAQSLAYLNAILRSGIGDRPMLLGTFITPSDDRYLRLKAYSGLGQGLKVVYYWDFGPTYVATENYWSDLRSEYDGIAKVNRALEQAEEILYPARTVRDPVAILYSVSHDLWHADENATDPAAFVEKRLLWHALRHAQVQPDFLREEDVQAGKLEGYKALYITDWCVSRAASEAIDEWVRAGGILYLSAGAATRDEFYEPYVPPFAKAVWPDDASAQLVSERSPAGHFGAGEVHAYNERTDLPTIKPMAQATVQLGDMPFELPVIGVRLNLRQHVPTPLATFDDGAPAAAAVQHGRGQVVGVGFLPMLAYGQLAGFKPTSLEEKWPAEPRELVSLPLEMAKVTPVARASVPVVEASLLTGPRGSALVLANYTYVPIQSLRVELKMPAPPARAVSTEGSAVGVESIEGGVRLELPLEWTDIILLPNE